METHEHEYRASGQVMAIYLKWHMCTTCDTNFNTVGRVEDCEILITNPSNTKAIRATTEAVSCLCRNFYFQSQSSGYIHYRNGTIARNGSQFSMNKNRKGK